MYDAGGGDELLGWVEGVLLWLIQLEMLPDQRQAEYIG